MSDTAARDLGAELPSCRLGFINPLDLIDTFPYEFYRLAPSNAIASMISIGLRGFSGDAATEAVEENLERCLETLTKRKVQFVTMGGLPLLYNLGEDWSRRFREICEDKCGVRGGTSVDAVIAAFRSLRVRNVVVVDKWDDRLNGLVASSLANAGVNLLGAVTQVHTADQVKTTFENGAEVALRLAESALKQYPDADCLFIAGGAWLVAPFIAQIEEKFGISVVAGQQSKIWYSLNMVDNHLDRPGYGRLLTTPMTPAPGSAAQQPPNPTAAGGP